MLVVKPFVLVATILAIFLYPVCDGSSAKEVSSESTDGNTMVSSSSTKDTIWMDQMNIQVNRSAITFEETNVGLGVIANSDLPEGIEVMRTPMSALINIEHAVTSLEVGHVFSDLEDFDDLDVMAAFIAYEKNKEGKSVWQPYLDSLPASVPNPLYWTDEEIAELQTSPVRSQITQRRIKLETSFAQLKDIFDIRMKNAPWFTLESYRWGHGILRSRSHVIGIIDSVGEWHHVMCLVPGADLFNTDMDDRSINVVCETDSEPPNRNSFKCVTTSPVAAHEQLLVKYVSKPKYRSNSHMLLNYGFVPDHNPYDTIALDLPERHYESADFHTVVMNALGYIDRGFVYVENVNKIRKSLRGLGLLTYFRIINLRASDVDDNRLEAAVMSLRAGSLLSFEHELAALNEMLSYLAEEESKHITSLQDDEKLFREGKVGEGHAALALKHRLNEKRSLNSLIEYYKSYRDFTKANREAKEQEEEGKGDTDNDDDEYSHDGYDL